MNETTVVDPELYSRDYFLTDNEGFREYLSGLDNNIHTKFQLALKYGSPSKGDTVLDLGCGRGELIYYCAKRGARVLGIDYSAAAIDIARQTIKKLPQEARHLAAAEVGDAVTYEFKERYDIVFMVEAAEHMHDWQLKETFQKINKLLKPRGRLIIATPNYYYEQYLSPLKRLLNIPLNLIKLPFRILKGKYKESGVAAGFKKIFRINVDRGELNRKMHVNIMTPGKLAKLLSDFSVQIICEDASKNILTLLSKKWCGREMVAVAVKKGS